jgi:hypothetical protein
MNAIRIEVAQNGYIITDAPSHNASSYAYASWPYVFQTEASMYEWISANLDKPTNKNKEP